MRSSEPKTSGVSDFMRVTRVDHSAAGATMGILGEAGEGTAKVGVYLKVELGGIGGCGD